MLEVKLGTAPVSDQRDAVHVAVIPMVAGEALEPGERIGIFNGLAFRERGVTFSKEGLKVVGIVDPYLRDTVNKKEKFYLCLLPDTVTGMRHHWLSPEFPSAKPDVVDDHEAWLRLYAQKMNCYETPDEAFETLLLGLKTGELFAHGSDLHGFYELDDAENLQYHAEQYLGIRIDFSDFTFSCSC